MVPIYALDTVRAPPRASLKRCDPLIAVSSTLTPFRRQFVSFYSVTLGKLSLPVYMDTLTALYEAYTIYSFVQLLMHALDLAADRCSCKDASFRQSLASLRIRQKQGGHFLRDTTICLLEQEFRRDPTRFTRFALQPTP